MASIFFGSNYVPTKNYPTGDGMAFVWVFASGVMSVGIVSIFLQHDHGANLIVFDYSGILGGCLWAAGNLCVIPVVKLIGLGLGMIMWGATSLITGFFFAGKFGFFGLASQTVPHPMMNWFGIVLIIVSLVFFFFVKPTLTKEKQGYESVEEAARLINSEPVIAETSFLDRIPGSLRYVVGSGLAVLSGILYGVNMVPMKQWSQHIKDTTGVDAFAVDFVLSHFVGIYIFSTVIFLVYCITKRPPQVFAQTMLPAYISGAMWGIAQIGLMMATDILGYTVGFPIGSTGPIIVSSLWSVLYFREIRGSRNFMYLGISFALLITGVILLALSSKA